MLRTDFNGYKEFEKKLMNAKRYRTFKAFYRTHPGMGK